MFLQILGRPVEQLTPGQHGRRDAAALVEFSDNHRHKMSHDHRCEYIECIDELILQGRQQSGVSANAPQDNMQLSPETV